MVFPCAPPFSQLFLIRPMLSRIIEQIAKTVLPQSNPSFLGALPQYRDHAMLAVEITHAQIGQLRDTNTRVVQQPQNGPVAHGCSLGEGASLMRRGTGIQELFKLFGCDRL